MTEQRSTLIIEISSEQAARNARALDRELQSIERTGNYATTSMNSMSVAARQLTGYLAGVVTVGTAISKMDTYTGLNNKLKLVTKSQSELNTAMNDTFKIAQNTAQAWDSVAQIYQRFSDNAQRLNITQAKTAELTDTVAKAIAISGGSAASAEAALVQFSQALASNVLRGEELNSVMEQAPGLAKAIAQGMGITVGQLRSVAAEGKITGDVLVDALTKARGSVNELFGKTDFTIAQSFTQLSNEVTKFVGEAGKGSGAAKVLSSSISALAENLAPIANAGAALAIGMLTKAMISNAAATTSATYSLIAKVDASIAERNANIAAAQAEVASAAAEAQSTQVTLTNIKATHAQIMAEIELEKVRLKAQITDQGRMATTTRMAQLGRLQAQVALEVAAAESAQTASSARLSAALTAQTVATSRLALAKSALMAIFSPMGLAIAATAATFYLLSSSSDEVKESLATQADSVESLTKKYLELNTVQALVEGVRLRKEIEQQNDVIDDASSATKRFAYIQKELFKLSGNDYADYQKAVTSIAKGASDAGDLLNKMIASGRFSQNQIDKLVEFSGAVAESKNKIEQNNNALKLLNATSGQHVEVTADSIKQLTIQTNLTKVATQNFTDMKTQMLDSLQAQVEFIRLNGGSEEQVNSLNKVIQAYSLNQLTATDAVKKFNSSAKVPSDVIKGLIDYASKTDQAKFAMNQANTELKAIQENGSKAKQGFIDASQGASTAMSEVDKLNEKMKEFNKTIAQRKFDAGYQQILITQYGKTPEQAAAMLKVRKEAEKIGLKNPTAEMLKNELSVLSIENKLKDTIEAKSKAEKDRTKELKDQENISKRLIGISGNSGIGTGAHLDVRYGGSRDGQKVSPEHIARLQAGGKSLSSYRVSSDYGQRKAPTAGASSFHKGIDFAMPVGTPITTKVAVKDVKTAYDPKGGGYYSTVTFEDGVVLKLLHQSPSMQSKVKGGASAGTYASYAAQEKSEVKTEQEIESLRANYYSLGEKDEADHIKRLKDLRKNGLEELVADENARFEKTKQLRQFEFTMEVDGWRWVGEEKIKNDAFAKKLRVEASTEFNKKEKAESIRSIDEQREYELEQFRLTKEQQLLQSKEFYMSELQLAQAKYDIERRLLDQSNEDPKEKSFKTQMLALQHQADLSRRLKDATTGWESVQAQMNGSTGRYQVSQDRLSRMGVSQNLLETQSADVERQEQEPGADLQKLAEVREQIWADHNKRMIDIENQYQTDSLNLQLTQAQQLTGSFANMFKGILGESSGAYKTMFAMQQGFALTQAGMNLWSSVSDAYAKEPGTVWQKVAAGAKAALDQGTFLAMIQAITPQGFATGGHITGKGTGTSDDIPIMASNGEFMMRQYAASKIGLVALNYMNQTGEIPFQREYIGMKSQYLGSTQPDLNVQKFKDGGLVGVTRINNADAERSQFNSVLQTNIGSSQPKVTIINQTSQPVEATTQWDGSELQVVLKEMQKQNEAQTKSLISQSWRDAERQGGALDRIKKGR
ncbi:tape measure protein [Acinetobacter sp. ULE_I057]|uniref:tape measure protein n=1 Tax=Acinetobacter sp. ULE_I057 TaxID=3373070 RepID=UPI003AF74D0E